MILITDGFLIFNFYYLLIDKVEALALSPDGTLLATGARDKDIILSSLFSRLSLGNISLIYFLSFSLYLSPLDPLLINSRLSTV